VSSEIPIAGRGLLYHQEMDPVAYRPAGWLDPRNASSFVNCMPSMGACWDLLVENARRDPGRGLRHRRPDGVIKPYSRPRQSMARVGWGWHDKAQGDGFGHVIHSWAAVGRPLIGHASHYRGKMAEPFWVDGVTCLDLDRRSVRDVPWRRSAR
jgi:hypothetical protein